MTTIPSSALSRLATAVAILLAATSLTAQGPGQPPARPKAGPVISPFGATYAVPGTALMLAAETDYKVKFDVSAGQSDPSAVNAGIDSVARFINMHVRAGVPLPRLQAALVLHGSAARDALGHAGYRARFGVDNPNLALLEALARAGVRIYLCGQSASARGLGWEEVAPVAKIALSAMTAHAVLAQEGYSTNP